MPASKDQAPPGTLQNLSFKMPDGFKSKVVAPRNPKLVKGVDKHIKLTPSVFIQEMALTTEQKLASIREMHPPRIIELLDMSETTHQKFTTVDIDQAMFQPFPSEIVFQNYIPCETYEVPLVLRNNDKIPRLVKVIQETSPYFQIISPLDVCSKVAPGMASTFNILFTPEENKDYLHRLVCVTEREKFAVAIRAIGARALLDFPDHLNFSTCPVKCLSQRTLLVRNIGNSEARFTLSTQSPFCVEPSLGTLGVGESMQVIVDFLPKQTGDHSEDLVLHYDTGEDIYISLYGAATDINVRLDKNSVIIEKTFLSLANQRVITISNRSDVIVHFQWKAFATQEEEDQQKLRFSSELQKEEDDDMDLFLAECSADPTLRERISVLSRTFQNRQRLLQDDQMIFSDDIFHIDLLEGDIWPNSTAEVNIIFKPKEAKVYQQTIYCDITGRETRLPLRVKGEGIGAKLLFNFDQLHVGNIFVGSKHSYEAILSNKGDIDAIFSLVPPSSALGSCFSFNPSEGVVLPGGYQAIEVSFSSSILGDFQEEFFFSIDGNPQNISVTFRGCVIGPTFNFNLPVLNFGDVSFGFPHTLTCCLHNTSLVPMTFYLRVPADGSEDTCVTSSALVSDTNRTMWRGSDQALSPREFTVTPSTGTIRSQGLMDVQVTLCSNRVQRYEFALVVDVEGIGEEVLALPIVARCVVPPLRVVTPVLEFRRCFLNYPYHRTIQLANDDDLPACYGLLPQVYEENSALLYSSPQPRGIIEPHSTLEIPLVLQAALVGRLDVVAEVVVFGSEDPPLEVLLSCMGEGPVVHVSCIDVDFGNIPVLTDVSRTLQLSNQCPIPAHFLAQMVRSNSHWRLEPSEGVVPPDGVTEIRLVANLDDTLRFQNKIHLVIENSQTHTIPVMATGTGTTIVTDRPFAPELNLGARFSSGSCQYHFKLTNMGRRCHQLYWMTEGFPQFRRRGQIPLGRTQGSKLKNTVPEPPSPVFKLHPLRTELHPGQSVDMVLEGSSDTPKVVKETLICQAIIGKQSGKERIMKVDVTCEFIAPVLDISNKQLSFCVEKGPTNVLVPQYKSVLLKNVSSLPLNMQMTLEEPFSICDKQGDLSLSTSKTLMLSVGEEVELWVQFEPSYRKDCYSWVAEECLVFQYLEHPQKDYISLHGEVHFPNLHFSSMEVNFGCILNDTEVLRTVDMSNCSPLLVKYRWSFLVDDWENKIRCQEQGMFVQTEEKTEEQGEQTMRGVDDAITDSNREIEVPKLTFGYAEEEASEVEKTDAENERREGAGSPKDLLPCLSTHSLMREPIGSREADRLSLSYSQDFTSMPLCQHQDEHHTAGVEEVFDILPLYGILQPNETQQVDFTFYGHADISGQVLALCEVEGGPTYEITLKGEASLVRYAFDRKEIDYGQLLFDHMAEAEITLKNTGKVGFEFSTLNVQLDSSPNNPRPGLPLVIPSSGFIEANSEQTLSVFYLPGVPEHFHKSFEMQVSYFEPDSISVRGEGIFPRIYLDLPRNITSNKWYSAMLKEAKISLERETWKEEAYSRPGTMTGDQSSEDYIPSYDSLLQMEVERLLMKEHALEQEGLISSCSEDSNTSQQWRKKLPRCCLPEYTLDFGYVIHGNVSTHIVKVTNTGPLPVSFHADRRDLANNGFSTELDRVKNLPYCETETFEVRFDPRGANLNLGEIDALMPIQVLGGPTIHVRLLAVVTMPSLTVSTDKLEFGTVQCGQCQVMTVQLYNHLQVTCEWAVKEGEKTKKKIDKYIPLHLRRKARQELKAEPLVFEMLPPSGVLLPGERINVQVKFSPAEEKLYSHRLALCISQSSHRVMLLAQGKGLELQLDFSPTVLEFGPILPQNNGDDVDVLVKNPCAFPIEFYALEYDKQYLEEEKILRMIKGYDCHNIMLLPPRAPGEKLPSEILEYFEERRRAREEQPKQEGGSKKEEEDRSVPEQGERRDLTGAPSLEESDTQQPTDAQSEEEDEEMRGERAQASDTKAAVTESSSSIGVGDLDTTPVSKIIAKHMGIDLTPEGLAARNRRGIAIIVHGAPLSGKTSTSVTLAKHYGTPCLNIDSMVLEAVSNGNSPVGLRARELCARAAVEQAQRKAEDAAAEAAAAAAGAQAPGFLSVEAVTKHTAEGSQTSEGKQGPHSSISTRNKASTVGGKGKTESSHTHKQQTSEHIAVSQSLSVPVPAGLPQRRLSVSASVAGELGLLSCTLPEELLVDILTERLQLNDCHRGVVFDSLETLYSHSMTSTLHAILKALNNRRYIYLINLKHDYTAFKAREKAQKEEEARLLKESIEREKVRMEEMDEEEYDALSDEERARIDRRRLDEIRERKRREQLKLEREMEERRQQEQLERLREEEEMKKKNKKGKLKELSKEDQLLGKRSQQGVKQATNNSGGRSDTKMEQLIGERKMSYQEKPESLPTEHNDVEDGNKKKKIKEGKDGKAAPPEVKPSSPEEAEKEPMSEGEKLLVQRFKLYNQSQKAISQTLDYWDRVQGVLIHPVAADDTPQEGEEPIPERPVPERPGPERTVPSGKKGRKEREKERAEKERLEKEKIDRLKVEGEFKACLSPAPSPQTADGDGVEAEEQLEARGEVGVPHILLNIIGQDDPSAQKVLESRKLPPLDEVLDGLGQGPKGPPIPPSTIFSVVPYPGKRTPPNGQDNLSHFEFLVPSSEDVAEDKKEAELEMDSMGSISILKDDAVTPTRGRLKKEKVDPQKRRTSTRKGQRGGDTHSLSLGALTPVSDADQGGITRETLQDKSQRLTTFRWLVPPNGEVTLRIHFNSTLVGTFDQTLNFELTGTKRRYSLYCRGVCAFPSINKDPRVVFAHRQKMSLPDKIIHKKYIMKTDVFEFGPLLCGKTRDRYKEGKYPENMEKLTIQNNSPFDTEIFFCFQHDMKATTFLLDPPTISLKPNEKQELSLWAYPTTPGVFEDTVVCCIKENPEPVLFKVSCQGVRPELELDRKSIHFDRILLHRKDTKTIHLRNINWLPVAWKLSGLEMLGDEFLVTQDQGIIEPKSEFPLQMHFRAMKPINLKKAIRLEVSDVENILGIVHTENIQIHAEAYDVALDLSFPKGTDGGLDFGVIKVAEEAKLTLSLKNKGKYEIAYSFTLEATEPDMPDLHSLFTIQPHKGTLNPSERPMQVQIIFRSRKEVVIKDQAILRCKVIEPNVSEGGETIACIPVKVSIRSLFSKYSFVPGNDLNFGAIVFGIHKIRTFTIENKGEFEIRYTIFKMMKELPVITQKKGGPAKRNRSCEDAPGKLLNKARRSDSIQKDMGITPQARFTVGVFTVSPGFGTLSPGGHQVISVDCAADQPGKCEEFVAIDISDRDPEDQPRGIAYRLVAEACIQSIVTNDIASIFEEHRICKNINLYQSLQTMDCGGIFVEDENKFLFNNVLVGRQVKARFKIINTGKVHCDLSVTVKPVSSKAAARITEVFEVEPTRMCVPSHSHSFAVVTFSPQTMQNYQCIFEAAVEGFTSSGSPYKTKSLMFDIAGDGNLPRVTVLRPSLRNKKGNPLLLFRRLLLGCSEKLPLLLKNDSNVPAQVNIDLLDEHGAFTLQATPNTHCTYISQSSKEDDRIVSERNAHTSSLVMSPGQSAEFVLLFSPSAVRLYKVTLRLLVVDNKYEETVVQLLGEGYQDEITLDNIHKAGQTRDIPELLIDQDTEEANHSEHIYLGYCHIGRAYQETFTMTNHSNADAVRFEWPADSSQLKFSPQVGHLHSGCAKDITMTFRTETLVTLRAQLVKCKISKIAFQQPVDQVPDWDNRQRTVKWVDIGRQAATHRPAKKKVIETDPEPAHTVLENTARELPLQVSAVADYAQFQCKAETIRFKDTLLFQTRVFEFQMMNKGNVQLEFSWQVLMESYGKGVSFSEKHANLPEGQGNGTRPLSRSGSRPVSALESVSPLLTGDPDLPPFIVEPSIGVIAARKKQVFLIKFSPLDVAEFEGRLVCSIPNLKDDQGPTMAVKGRSLLPFCHFDIVDSDYISSNQRDPELRGPRGAPPRATLDSNTRVIEFFSVGLSTTITRTFDIMNPTNAAYSFQWRCDDPADLRLQPVLRCLTEKGTIRAGKKVENTFEFLPQQLDTTESFWTFLIPEHNIAVPFLLVGHAREPSVYLDRSYLNYRSLLIGLDAHETVYIVNSEETAFNFSFRETSRHSEGFQDSLTLQPMEGVVPPKSRVPVVISFNPTHEGKVNINLMCDVKGKTFPLTMNVKVDSYSMNASLQYEKTEGESTQFSQDKVNEINFQQVELNEKAHCNFLVSNTGKFILGFQWELWGPKELLRFLKVVPETGSVVVGQQTRSTLSFYPLQRCVLKDVGLKLKIKNGPTFNCTLAGSAVPPGVHFSFTKHNFGMNFLAGLVPCSQKLVITNKGEKEASIECLFTNTAYLVVGHLSEVLPPGGVVEVPITFYPKEAIKYKETVTFEINGFTQQSVEILGQGIEMKVELGDPKQKMVNLGALRVGQTVKRLIPLVNNSHVPLTFNLVVNPNQQALMDPKVFRVSPQGEVTLKASGGRCLVEVVFSPKRRVSPFTEEGMVEWCGTSRSLFMLRGCCQALEISLDQDYIPFGAVIMNSQASRRILMQNTGDIGASFKWDVQKFAPDFSISPVGGYISPGMEVTFDLLFSPLNLSQDIRYDNLSCFIEGGKPLKLTLTGSCVMAPITKEVVNFVCQVRTRQSQSILLQNKTNQLWNLRPVIEGEQWSGSPSFVVEPHQQNKPYEITYRPLTMTLDGKKHQGSVFFAFPDGTGLIYLLQGFAEPPKSSGNITREVPSKTSYSELLPISNWLPKPQRFRVIVELIKSDKLDCTTLLKGLDYIEVPALTKRDYKLNFFSYKEGQFSAKVTFRNETTLEYLYYTVNFKATPPGIISTIEMTSPVRQCTSAVIKVDNPLLTPVTFTTDCKLQDINFPTHLTVPAQSEGTLMFEFQPLKSGETTGRLTLQHHDLGFFQYELVLKALPAGLEKPLYFRTTLGSSQAINAKFINFCRVKTEYTCKIDSPDFHLEKTISAAPGSQGGTEVSVEVIFEPSQLGETRGVLSISSPVGGDYAIPLYGTCGPPKAQGPFPIRTGSSASIPFKNIFLQTTAFSFQVDNPAFTVKPLETVRSKKTHSVLVSFEGNPTSAKTPVSGKMTVSCPRSEGTGQSISWVYYLKGVTV
ncbi:hydrocephalus-inducing protein-like [Acipenser ruthenus]|uniref:hydrocephalus-inducing protein-like n=1 Tax=Acipenser ruthenus TaxID=7906 RepID=UPI002742040B|nr:hydrocephalus-inducing protein-like [Acipenser ruthenus]XP_058848772.1 hydrocephalus-inducing protein-like [Acipenser ruthenus]